MDNLKLVWVSVFVIDFKKIGGGCTAGGHVTVIIYKPTVVTSSKEPIPELDSKKIGIWLHRMYMSENQPKKCFQVQKKVGKRRRILHKICGELGSPLDICGIFRHELRIGS